ncbi:hypothetical protein, partial [Glaciibacter superstes]|uniref:hypothetical protein n=1 Tax=Glaciibacter superstes TaxID=501023 RepID=UPI001B7FBBDE
EVVDAGERVLRRAPLSVCQSDVPRAGQKLAGRYLIAGADGEFGTVGQRLEELDRSRRAPIALEGCIENPCRLSVLAQYQANEPCSLRT